MSTGTLAKVQYGAPVDEVMALIRRDGGVILENALSEQQVERINADVDDEITKLQCGSIKDDPYTRDFHGDRTKRLTNLITLSKTYREDFVDNDVTVAYVRAMFAGVSETAWLNAEQLVEIHPGEKAQILHRDMGNYPLFFRYGPQGPEVMINFLVALMDVTEEIGATRVIPGSHEWEFDAPYTQEMTIPAEMKAGSAFLYSGKLVHGGGANRSLSTKRRVIATAFNPGFLVPEEAYPFVVPLELVQTMSPRLQQMIGFRSIHQRELRGGSLWQHNYEDISLFLGLDQPASA